MRKSHYNKYIFVNLLVGLIFFGFQNCSTTQKKEENSEKNISETTSGNSEEKTGNEVESRETPGLKQHSLNGPFKISVLSSAPGDGEMLENNSRRFRIPIGSAFPVECTLMEGNQSPSYVIKKLFEKFKNISGLENPGIKNISAGVLAKIPYLYMEMNYLTRGKKHGNVKYISLSSIGFVLTCFHDEPGYEKTFLNVAESLAATSLIQDFLGQLTQYSSRSINLIKINENISGFTEIIVFNPDDKTENYYTLTNMILKKGESELTAAESVEDVFIDKSTGYIFNGKYYSFQDNAEEYQIELQEGEPRHYSIKGSYLGEKINNTLESPYKIMHLDSVVKKIFSDPKLRDSKKSLQFYEYQAGNPGEISGSKIAVKSADDKLLKLNYVSLKTSMGIEADKNGISLIEMSSEGSKISIYRVYSE